MKPAQTLLFCAGGQSSSLTPNVTPGDGFFSKGFLISPGMPFLHVPLSFGGLVSSACNMHENACGGRIISLEYNTTGLIFLAKVKKNELVLCENCVCSHLCACSSSPAQVWVSVDLLLWSPLYLPAACVWYWATGVRAWATAPSCCLSGWVRHVKHKMSFPIRADLTSTVCEVLPSAMTSLLSVPSPLHLPHQGVVLLDLPADEVMAGEDRVLKKERKRKEGNNGTQ